MKEVIKPVFTCDFCKKNLFIKHAMSRHESNCSKNPNNYDACHGCAHCEEVKVEYHIDGDYGGQEVRTRGFHCNHLNIDIYPHKALRKGLPERYPETFEGKQVMPNECEHCHY